MREEVSECSVGVGEKFFRRWWRFYYDWLSHILAVTDPFSRLLLQSPCPYPGAEEGRRRQMASSRVPRTHAWTCTPGSIERMDGKKICKTNRSKAH